LQTSDDGKFLPIGSEGFYARGGRRAMFDQQPIEAATTIDACEAALRITGQTEWRREMERAFAWFCGANSAGVPLFDPETGACCDGVTPSGLNLNKGAESTLAFVAGQVVVMRMRRAASREDVNVSSGGAFLG
jgi:hypothetical protein